MRSITAIALLGCLFTTSVFAQGEIDEQDKIFYRDEKTVAATISTNGFGGGFRYAKRIDAFKKTTYEIEYAQIRHQKEHKIPSLYSQQIGGNFVYGKQNALGNLRLGIGLQKELYRKLDKGGISIRYFYNFGASIGLQKPVYYVIFVAEPTSDSTSTYVEETRKFESHLHMNNIKRKSPFYEGMREIKLVPGAYAKIGFTFEFSKYDAIFRALEVGVVVDTYIRKVPIMANELNHWIFPAFYVSGRFGKIVNSQFNTKTNKLDKLLLD